MFVIGIKSRLYEIVIHIPLTSFPHPVSLMIVTIEWPLMEESIDAVKYLNGGAEMIVPIKRLKRIPI